jgi:ATP phosphoribosyltransferase regulatory subunit
MKKWHIYTPEGVSDILFAECARKRALEADLRTWFTLSGYREMETPALEFYDVFGGDNALIRQEQMFKFTDAQGRLLVLKPDMTIPVARVAATRFRNPSWPVKCFYVGNTFSADETGGGRQSEFTQAGIEILGTNTPEADAEVIATAVRAVLATGIEDFQIDIGQVEFFRGLMEESGLLEAEIEEVRSLIDRKDFVGVEEVAERHDIPAHLKSLILDLPKLFGSKEIIQRLEGQQIGMRATAALESLKTVLEILEDRGVGSHVSVDLGMIQSLNYYTGIVFRGYTHGVGFPILSGGRYDNLVSRFGLDCPATGFSMGVNLVLRALEHQRRLRQAEQGGILVTYEPGGRKMAIRVCDAFRAQGRVAELDITGGSGAEAEKYARQRGHVILVCVGADGKITEYAMQAPAEGETE